MHVENKTIIITDPCYIINDCIEKNPYPFPYTTELKDSPEFGLACKLYRDWEQEHDDWQKCGYGENMEALGIENYLTSSTIYGDWSCTTYNEDTKEPIGKFCADAGLVSVFVLDEVRTYNPNIDDWIENHFWCVTTIENFTGDVDIEIVDIEGFYEEDSSYTKEDGTPYHLKGEHWEDQEVRVIGKGSINFFTTQTGL